MCFCFLYLYICRCVVKDLKEDHNLSHSSAAAPTKDASQILILKDVST